MAVAQALARDGVPLVSVGIPTFNRPAGLRRTLECIRSQTYRNLEILVSDNCSDTVESRAIALAHQQADSRVQYHRQARNIGREANFKFLLERARGEFFFWAADDDEWMPDFVAVCLEHIGSAGSVMTGMRNAVRPRGLLRWKPPCDLSLDHTAFANAVSFFNNLQPSLFYGIHRTDSLRQLLGERLYDYYDCFFIFRQILTVGFQTAPPVCFHVGVDSEAATFKPAQPRGGAVYEYWPFLRDSLRLTLGASRLGGLEKARLAFLLCFVALNEFAHFEREARPRPARLASAGRRLMRGLRPLFRVPLPPPPPTMVLPADPAAVCTVFVAHARLERRESLEAEIAEAQRQLRMKQEVIAHLEAARPRSARPPAACDPGGGLLGAARPDAPLPELRRRLGSLLLQLEVSEARIQKLGRARGWGDSGTARPVLGRRGRRP